MPERPKNKDKTPEKARESDPYMLNVSIRVLGRLLRRLDDDDALAELPVTSALNAVGPLLEKIERIRRGRTEEKEKPAARYPDLKALLEHPAPQRSLERYLSDGAGSNGDGDKEDGV